MKPKAYFKSWLHSLRCKEGKYTIDEPFFRIGPFQFWHTIKIACLCGKVFYDINNEIT